MSSETSALETPLVEVRVETVTSSKQTEEGIVDSRSSVNPNHIVEEVEEAASHTDYETDSDNSGDWESELVVVQDERLRDGGNLTDACFCVGVVLTVILL